LESTAAQEGLTRNPWRRKEPLATALRSSRSSRRHRTTRPVRGPARSAENPLVVASERAAAEERQKHNLGGPTPSVQNRAPHCRFIGRLQHTTTQMLANEERAPSCLRASASYASGHAVRQGRATCYAGGPSASIDLYGDHEQRACLAGRHLAGKIKSQRRPLGRSVRLPSRTVRGG
jgi:hypothetical protein